MRKLIKKYYGGGGVASPSSIGQLIQNRDLGIIKQQANLNLSKGLQLPDNSSSVYGTSGLFSKANIGNTMNIAGGIADMLGGFLPEKNEYQGPKGNITRAIDTGYDTASDIAMSINPIIGGAMKVGGFVSDGINAITGGTDGMTTTDAIFGSTLGNLLGVGIINSAFGKKADTMYKDNATWEQQGSSYGGSLAKVDDAMTKSGKKYGAFSGKGRRAANRQIAEAKRQQEVIQGINNEAQDAFLSSSNMESINNIGTSFQLQGGYNQQNVRMGRHGMNIQTLNRAKSILENLNKSQEIEWLDTLSYDPTEIILVNPNDIPEFQEGGVISQKIRDYYKDYNLDKVTVMQGEPRTEADTIYANNDEDQAHELWHWISKNRPNENLKYFYDNLNDQRIQELGGDLNFVKRTGDPGNFYHPSEIEARLKAAKFMSQGQSYTKDFFNSLRKDENKYGYNMRDLLHMYNDENLEKLFNTSLQSFKDGGSINVIPEGALHARKHNMDMEGITKKGIPVVADKENGGVEQQAEIEREEIIFRLEVTKKLEELEKKYYNSDTSQKEKDELALEAGKLLVQEILYNTMDNVNLINKV